MSAHDHWQENSGPGDLGEICDHRFQCWTDGGSGCDECRVLLPSDSTVVGDVDCDSNKALLSRRQSDGCCSGNSAPGLGAIPE